MLIILFNCDLNPVHKIMLKGQKGVQRQRRTLVLQKEMDISLNKIGLKTPLGVFPFDSNWVS